MAIKQKTEQKGKLIEVLTKEYRWENLLLGVLAIISAALAVMILTKNSLLTPPDDSFPIIGGDNFFIFAWVLLIISVFGIILVVYPFFIPAIPELKKISWAGWRKFLDNSVRVLFFLAILTGFLLLFNFLIIRLLVGNIL